MKNYLKKAISAVIALALAASIVPASFAANVVLTDVPETADYATAVNALVALKVIDGYTDNTFLPDNNITRAEASKVVVAALNETASAEAMKGATKFSDIEAKHEWATGYINKGVSMGYINGMENNTFQPDGNVTYAQIIKMMLCAMGYEDYAASLAEQYNYTGANWYIPFIQLADEAGVTEGVYSGPNEAVTRAQVAQLVYNAIKAPIVKNVGISYTESGKIVPRIEIQDGIETSVFYRSILTEKFDAYFVEGYVTKISKDDGSGLKADEVNFGIAKSKKYAEEDVRYTTTVANYNYFFIEDAEAENYAADRVIRNVKVGDTDAANNKAVYATAIIMLDEFDDWTFLNFVPSGKNKVTKFNVKDVDNELAGTSYDLGTAADSKPFLKFFVDGATTSTKYPLNALSAVKVYVNGVEVGVNADTSKAAIETYILADGIVGDVELVDTYKTDGKIDAIYVNKYLSGMIRNVSTDGTISFQTGYDSGLSSITLDEENDEKEFDIYYNGEEITVADLEVDDVLTIAYDPTKDFEDSSFYEIYVSRDVVTDTLKSKNDVDSKIKLGDTYYEFAKAGTYASFSSENQLGDECIIYLDAFGRVFKAEQNASAASWGIAEKFAINTGAGDEEYRLTIFTADGATKVYYFDASKATVTLADETEINKSTMGDWDEDDGTEDTALGTAGLEAEVYDLVYASAGVKNALVDRVVQYKVNSSSGKITSLKFMPSTRATSGREEYDANYKKIGSGLKMSDSTKLIDATNYVASEYKDLSVASLDTLVDEVDYEAYAFGDRRNDNTYPFVIITAGEAPYTAKTRFAVITETGYSIIEDEDGSEVYSISAMYGAEKTLVASDDVDDTRLAALRPGEVIFFQVDASGKIKDFDYLLNWKVSDGSKTIPTYAQLVNWSLVNGNEDNNIAGGALMNIINQTALDDTNKFEDSMFTNDWDDNTNDIVKIVYGPVIDITNAGILFGKVDGTTTHNENDIQEYGFAQDMNVYTYDFKKGEDYRFKYEESDIGAIRRTEVAEYESDNNTIDWSKDFDAGDGTDYKNKAKVTFALAVVVDDEVQDIFAFMAK